MLHLESTYLSIDKYGMSILGLIGERSNSHCTPGTARYVNNHYKGRRKMLFCDLETERLLLKNISTEDTEFIYSQFSDSAVTRYLFDAEPLVDIKGAEEIIDLYIQPEPRGQHRWIIIRKSDGEKIGTCGFHCWNFSDSRIDVGYDLKEEFWGNGYMQEALQEILLFAKERMHIKEVIACIYKDNISSIHLAEKNGFVKSGEYYETFRGEKLLHYRYTLNL